MTTIVTRAGKGAALSAPENDANLNNLNNDKVEKSTSIATTLPLVGGGDLSSNRAFSVNVATELAPGVSELADQNEANALVDTTRALTPGRVPTSSETQKGVVELASAAETTTGTDSTRAVHPAGLKVELDKKANLSGAAFTGPVTVQSAAVASAPAQLGQVNVSNGIINGALVVWQNGTSFAAIADGTYTADNFKYRKVGTMVDTAAQAAAPAVAVAGLKLPYLLKCTVTTAQAALSAGDFAFIETFVEGYLWNYFAQRDCTIDFVVNSSVIGTFCLHVRNAGNDQSFIAEFTVNAANTDEKKTIAITASPSAGTWDYANGAGAKIGFVRACGATFQGSTGWQASNKYATANQVNAVAAVNSTFSISGLKISPGPVALLWTPDQLNFNTVLRSCATRYQKSYDHGTVVGAVTANGCENKVAINAIDFYDFGNVRIPIRMADVPVISLYSIATGASGMIRDVSASADRAAGASAIGECGFRITGTGMVGGNAHEFHWVADKRF